MKPMKTMRTWTVGLGQAIAALTVCVSLSASAAEWEDHTLLHSGKERPRSTFASFPSVEEAKAIRPEGCSRRLLLDSETEWRFSFSMRPEDRPKGFERPEYDVSAWDVVKVPCSWQAMGINTRGKPYGFPYYTNASWPFVAGFPANSNSWPRVRGLAKGPGFTMKDDENPVGCYRRDFSLSDEWFGGRVYLEFGAVDSFFYLWVNGRYVGFSKSSRDPACFNVTPFVKPGRNTVALEVYRFCDGSYLEAQDMLLMSGIARSVWLYRTPATHIRDVQFTAAPAETGAYGGDWNLNLDVDVEGDSAHGIAVAVFDEAGNAVPFRGKVGAKATLTFGRPRLWSAETPNLYTLVVALKEGNATTEAVSFQLGFREVEIRDAAKPCDRTFLINGQPVKLRGANRHETSPLYGHYTPDSLIELDVKLLKRANCNHVRNSHYPQPDYFYYLCNKYGIYVMDEANLESHGFHYGKESLSHVKSWEPAHVDRVMNMVERNKCHPSVVVWSLGNEAGPGACFKACVAAVKARDLSRPVQYERNNWITDMGARQYPTVQWTWDAANAKEGMAHEPPDKPLRYPFHINEYAHNMGNAMGDLKDYQDAIESTTRIFGSAIWDWVDQGIWKENADGRRIIAYGGDWGDFPHCGAFMMNGCVLADRTPEPGCMEIKHVFQPIVAVKGRDGKSIEVTNRHYFRDLSAYECRLTRYENGEATESRTIDLNVGARGATVIPVSNPTGSWRIEFKQKEDEGFWPKGWVIADDQIDFTLPQVGKGTVAGQLEFGFDPSTGELKSLKCGRLNAELLREPFTLDVFRAASQNEPRQKRQWMAANAASPKKRLVSFADLTAPDGVRRVEAVTDYVLANTTYRVSAVWTIQDGAARVKATFTKRGAEFEPAHVGFRTVFDFSGLKVEWLGRGPWENYSDRKSGAFIGLWSLASDEFFFPYDVPQDCGNREDTYRVKLSRLFDAVPLVTFETAEKPFAFEVNPYAPETLVKYRHPAELPTSDSVYFGIWAKSRGLGGNSCGPLPLEHDIITGETYTFEFTVR